MMAPAGPSRHAARAVRRSSCGAETRTKSCDRPTLHSTIFVTRARRAAGPGSYAGSHRRGSRTGAAMAGHPSPQEGANGMTNSKLVVAAIAALGLTSYGAGRAYAQSDDEGTTGDEGTGDGDATPTG